MSKHVDDTTLKAVKYYLNRTARILKQLSGEPDPDRLLSIRLAPDMLDTGFNFAIAIQFAARALCPPAGLEVPEIPNEYTCESLLEFEAEISELIAPISPGEVKHPVAHTAGDAELHQEPADYVIRFAFPNMLFHLSVAYAGLRHGGMKIGKRDFDGLHAY